MNLVFIWHSLLHIAAEDLWKFFLRMTMVATFVFCIDISVRCNSEKSVGQELVVGFTHTPQPIGLITLN